MYADDCEPNRNFQQVVFSTIYIVVVVLRICPSAVRRQGNREKPPQSRDAVDTAITSKCH